MDLLFFPLMVGAIFLPAAWLLRRQPSVEALALGAVGGILLFGALAFLRFLLLLPFGLPRNVGLLALALSAGFTALLWLATRHGESRATSPVPRSIWAAIVGGALMTLGFEATLPHFGAIQWSFDWWLHFDLTHFFLSPADPWRVYPGGDVVTSRTPLYNLLGSLALQVFGNRFTVLQVFTAAVGWLWLLPAALLARRLTTNQGTVLALLALSPLIRFSNVYTWPKGLVMFFLLVALERALALRGAGDDRDGRIAVEAGLASGGALMAHVGFAGFLLPIFFVVGWHGWRRRNLTGLGYLVGATGTVVLPWFAWGIAEYGWQRALLGYYHGQPSIIDPVVYGLQRVVMVLSGIVPVTPPLLGLTQDYFLIYVGSAAGVGGIIFLVWTAAQNLWRVKPPRAGWKLALAFTLSGFILVTLLSRQYTVDSAATLYVPALVVLAVLAVGPRRMPRLVIVGMLIETALFQVILISWMWSAASAAQPNAQLALAQGIRFLGRTTLPIGLGLMVAGFLCCLPALQLLSWPRLSTDHARQPHSLSMLRRAD